MKFRKIGWKVFCKNYNVRKGLITINNKNEYMKFKVFSELEYEVKMPSTFIFNIQLSRTSSQAVIEESITIDPYYQMEEFTSHDGKTRFVRLQVKDAVTF